MSNLSAPHFHDEEAAYAYVEARLWPNGPVCPRCGGLDRIGKMGGKSTRVGTYKCYECRKPFTVKIGTIFEDSKVGMRLWLQAMYLIAGSKKGISSNQLHRILDVTLKTAWFMSHRIREAIGDGDLAPMGRAGGTVEVDETFYGQKAGVGRKLGPHHKIAVLGLTGRTSGKARAMVITEKLSAETLMPMMIANVERESRAMTDDFRAYRALKGEVTEHGYTRHSAGASVDRADSTIHTNGIEGYFSIVKRGMRSVYQFCSEKHLNRYVAEFDFRYNNRAATGVNDAERTHNPLRSVVGKRLTYQKSCARA